MKVEIDLQHFYTKFQSETNDVKTKVEQELKLALEVKNRHEEIVFSKKDYIKKTFDINLDDYPEIKDGILNKELRLEVIQLMRHGEAYNSNSSVLYNLNVYLNDIKRVHILLKKKVLLDKRANLSFAEYKRIVYNYYRYGVHKCLLEGYMYSFADEKIEFLINRYKTEGCKKDKKMADLKATKTKLDEIRAKGLIPYNKEDAEIAKLHGVKYNGVKYITYKRDNYYYKLEMTLRYVGRKTSTEFERIKTINANLRGMTQEEIASKCKNKEEIYALNCDITHKLGILLKHDKMSYLNFIRNAEQDKFTNGVYNRKNRQRFQS